MPENVHDMGYGVGWVTSSNGPWNYNPLGTSVINGKPALHGMEQLYFYSSSLSASLKLHYSSSLSLAQTSTDGQSLTMNNLKFNGCKVSSDSLTTNSPDTPDGLPVIEVFDADPNVLVVTSPSAQGSLTIDSNTGLQLMPLQDMIVYSKIVFNKQQEYNKLVSKFKQDLQKLISFEEDRVEKFDLKYNNQLDSAIAEQTRQINFGNINNT